MLLSLAKTDKIFPDICGQVHIANQLAMLPQVSITLHVHTKFVLLGTSCSSTYCIGKCDVTCTINLLQQSRHVWHCTLPVNLNKLLK